MTSDQADIKFSKFIRERDPICKRCHRRKSDDASHYWERGHSSTRYDPQNADGLCRPCHQIWEGRPQECEDFKRNQIGDEAYEALERKHNTEMKRSDAIAIFESFLHEYKKNKFILQRYTNQGLTAPPDDIRSQGGMD